MLLIKTSRGFSESSGIWKCWFSRRGENRSSRRKTSRSKNENQQQTQPTLMPSPGIELWPHWWEACMGGKCSTIAPSLLPHSSTFISNLSDEQVSLLPANTSHLLLGCGATACFWLNYGNPNLQAIENGKSMSKLEKGPMLVSLTSNSYQ